MRKLIILTLILLLAIVALFWAQQALTPQPEEPAVTMTSPEESLQAAQPEPVKPEHATGLRTLVPTLDAAAINERCDKALDAARNDAEAMASLAIEEISSETLLHTWDSASARLEDMLGPVYLLAYTHTDSEARNAGQACIVKTTRFETELFQDPRLYERVQTLSTNDPLDAKLREDLLKKFEDTGVALPEEKRIRAKAIIERVTTLAQEFQKNLRENREKLRFTPDEQAGLPETYTTKLEKDGEDFLIGFDYPEAYPFLTYAENAAARERMYRGFLNRGGEQNLKLLEEIVELRRELAGLYELPSYAEFVTRRYMSGSADAVRAFLKDVKDQVRDAERTDIDMLRQAKAEHMSSAPDEVQVRPWDKEFYLERLRNARFNVDQEALRKYFPTPETIAWALGTTGRLYGIDFHEQPVETWQEDIRYFDVHDSESGDFIGGLYLDLYPREGKYGHAAAFPIRGSSIRLNRYPVTALVTNFDRSGLTQREVETLLHELGHAVHGVLSHTRYVNQAGTSVERDFVEAPSQMYEEWAQRLQTLETMAQYCTDCPVIDAETVKRLDAARRLGKGLHYGRQWLYASFDMRLAGPESGPPLKEWARMEANTPLGHAEGTQFPGTFGHIAGGYAAGYYGYMWSEVLARDFVSVFGDNLFDLQAGHRFRETILSRGSEVPAKQMVRDFLGREPSREAFFKELRQATPE